MKRKTNYLISFKFNLNALLGRSNVNYVILLGCTPRKKKPVK